MFTARDSYDQLVHKDKKNTLQVQKETVEGFMTINELSFKKLA